MEGKSNLDKLFKATGLKQIWVAKQTGISNHTLSMLRNGHRKRDLYQWEAEAIAKAMGIDISELRVNVCP